ncbi:MAG: dTDP-4-dehydrorhamnose 3,5-epimerase [Cyclobacteriaceae bacterium]
MLKVIQTGIEGLIQLQPSVFADDRGWFMESFKASAFKEVGIDRTFLQDNISHSKKGVLRGLHFQNPPYEQAKLVWVPEGSVLDVAVDLRKDSRTYGKYFKLILDSRLKNMLFIPEGFAHGFQALEDSLFHYKCSGEYTPGFEGGIIWNDPDLAIEWALVNPVISDKDSRLPAFRELINKGLLPEKT